jgi:hypothetical protein
MSYICFYNPCNFGDAFFSSPFIRHICASNPSRTFYYFIPKADYIFSGYPQPNLHNILTTVLIENNETKARVIRLLQHNLENRYTDDTIHDNTRYIFFNIWCHALSCGDLVFDGLKTGFIQSLDMINTHYKETFVVNPEIPSNKIFPVVNIPRSIYIHNGYREWLMNWRRGAGGGRVLVFVFNFVLQSAVRHPYVMNDYIVGLARRFHDTHTFLVPNHAPVFDAWPNIICCDLQFEYSESERSFRNLFILETIVRECDIIVTQYCGASWIWFNQNLAQYYDTHKKPIYITHPVRDNDYAAKMNQWIRAGGGGRDIVEFVALADLPNVLIEINVDETT